MPVDDSPLNAPQALEAPPQEAPAIDQTVQQSGEYAVNIGQGQGIHIGPVYNQQIELETIKQIVREELRLPQKDYGNSVGRGLEALAELMRHAEVRAAVITFWVDFQAACERIEIIANYKELHDLLHTLEFQCYSGILQESKRFSNSEDETALEILMDHELTLQRTLRDVKDVAARETIATNELLWVKQLEQAQAELHAAIEELDTRHLQRAIWLLNRILAIQPSRINTNLNAAAKTLRLPALVNAMNAILDKLIGANLNQEKIQQFQTGVAVLAELNQRFIALVHGHDYGQEFDLELRRIDANLDKDLIELEMSWPDLKERAEVLFDAGADQWTLDFQRDTQNLDTALKAQNPAKIKRYFRLYRRRASERFFQVDVTLKRLCEELREVGEPLASVLRMIE
jgi:Effector-associated domain 10